MATETSAQQRSLSDHEIRCAQLESELANDWANKGKRRSQLPRIKADIRKYNSIYRRSEAAAETWRLLRARVHFRPLLATHAEMRPPA